MLPREHNTIFFKNTNIYYFILFGVIKSIFFQTIEIVISYPFETSNILLEY